MSATVLEPDVVTPDSQRSRKLPERCIQLWYWSRAPARYASEPSSEIGLPSMVTGMNSVSTVDVIATKDVDARSG